MVKMSSYELAEEMERPIPKGETVFCAGTMVRGEMVLVVDYEPNYENRPGYVQIKFPGGKNKDNGIRKDTTPYDTLCFEMNEELFGGWGKVMSYKPFHVSRTEGPAHTKFFSLLEVSGGFRQSSLIEEKEIDEKGRISYERIGRPRWEKVGVLVSTMFDGNKSALKALCERYASMSEEFMWAALKLDRNGF